MQPANIVRMNMFTQLSGDHVIPSTAKTTKRPSLMDPDVLAPEPEDFSDPETPIPKPPRTRRPTTPKVPKKAAPEVKPPSLAIGDHVGSWCLLEYRPGKGGRAAGTQRVYATWKCRCSCGTVRWVKADNLMGGHSRSCGHEKPNFAAVPSEEAPKPAGAYQIVARMEPIQDGRSARKSQERVTMEILEVGSGFWVDGKAAYWKAVNATKSIEEKKFKVTKVQNRQRWQVLRVK